MDEKDTKNIENLSEADKVFIPVDIDGDKTDYFDYKVKCFRTVPENCFLVKQNIFTGKRIFAGGRGFKAILPFYKSILVPAIDRLIDYKKIEYLTADGANVNVDLDVTVRITDPVKYLNEGKHQLSNLSSMIYSLLGNYIEKLNFADIKKGLVSRDLFASSGTRSVPYDVLSNELDQFEAKYGIHIGKLYLKDVRLPKDLEKVYNDRLEAQQKREAQKEVLAAQQEEAEMKAKIVGIETEAEVKRYQKLEEEKNRLHVDKMNKEINELKAKGFSPEQISEILKIRYASEGNNSHVIVGANSQTSDVAMGVIAGGSTSSKKVMDDSEKVETNKSTTLENNSTRFLKHIRLLEGLGKVASGTYKQMVDVLKESDILNNLNELNEKDYELFLRDVLNTNKVEEDVASKGRGR